MKNLKLLAISAALVIVMVLAGCASMQLQYLENDTVVGPKQVRQGQDISSRDVTVWGIYKDGSRKVVSGITISSFNSHTPGRQTVRVRAGFVTNQEVSFETEVMALRTLTVASPPRTVLYKVGEEPNWSGLEIRGEWDQMGSDRIDLSYCEITGFIRNQDGRQTIRVSYEGITTTFDVDFRSMTSIQIAQAPIKLDYFQGEELDLTGMKVNGVWEGFPTEELAITRNDVTGYSPNNSGIQHVTVTKNERSASFDVEVLALSSIIVDKPPTKTDYKVGEALDLTGIEITGNYTGADPTKRKSQLIPIDQLTTSGYEPNRTGRNQRVTVIVRGMSANFFVNIE